MCSKCKSENQRGRFCGHCGYQIKTPCNECGGWEPIGRVICLKKIEEAKEKLEKCINDAKIIPGAVMGMVVYFILVTAVAGIIGGKVGAYIWVFFFPFSLVSAPVLICLEKKRIKKAKEKFFIECPDYKEILEKTGELEKIT